MHNQIRQLLAPLALIAVFVSGCGLIAPTPISRTFKIDDLLLTNAEVPTRADYPPTKPRETIVKYGAYESSLMSWGTVPGIRYGVYRYQRVRYAQNTYEDLITQPIGNLKDWSTASLHADEYNFRCDSTVNGHVCRLKARYEEFFIEVVFIAPHMVLKEDIDLVVRNMDARMMKYLHK